MTSSDCTFTSTLKEMLDALPNEVSREDSTIKEEANVSLVFIKKEEENDEKFKYSNKFNCSQETAQEEITGCEIEYEQDSDCIGQNDMKEEGMVKDNVQEIFEGQKYLPSEGSEYKVDVTEHKYECPTDNVCVHEDHTQPSSSSDIKVESTVSDDWNMIIAENKQDIEAFKKIFQSVLEIQTASSSCAEKLSETYFAHKKINESNLQNNLQTGFTAVHKKIQNYECMECHKTFTRASGLRIHNDVVHKRIKNYKCIECSKMFSLKGDMQRHINSVHKKIKNYECNDCSRMFSQRAYMLVHIKRVHKGIKNYECNECHKLFFGISKLKYHVTAVHKRFKKYECYECNKMFCHKENIKIHINEVHQRMNQVKCNICFKIMSFRYLKAHVKTVHSKMKNYECDVCHKLFSNSTNLLTHISAVHRKMKKFECNECHKMFCNKQNMQTHINEKHKRRKKCNVCQKMFYCSYLEAHINTVHNKMKNFECNECHKTFCHKREIYTHITEVHERVKDKCNICHKMFPFRYLKVHVNTVHKK